LTGSTLLRRRVLEAPVLSALLIAAVIAAAVSSQPDAGAPAATAVGLEGHAYSTAARVLLYRSRGAASAEWDPVCRETASARRDQSREDSAAAALAPSERWAVYGPSALAPLAVSIDSWREDMRRGVSVAFDLTVINDTHRGETVDVRLHAVLPNGDLVDSSRLHRETAPALDRIPLKVELALPEGTPFLLIAEMKARNPDHLTVWSRRKIGFADPGAAIPDPPFRSVCCRVG
jgi:hypothetical protein